MVSAVSWIMLYIAIVLEQVQHIFYTTSYCLSSVQQCVEFKRELLEKHINCITSELLYNRRVRRSTLQFRDRRVSGGDVSSGRNVRGRGEWVPV